MTRTLSWIQNFLWTIHEGQDPFFRSFAKFDPEIHDLTESRLTAHRDVLQAFAERGLTSPYPILRVPEIAHKSEFLLLVEAFSSKDSIEYRRTFDRELPVFAGLTVVNLRGLPPILTQFIDAKNAWFDHLLKRIEWRPSEEYLRGKLTPAAERRRAQISQLVKEYGRKA